MKKSLVLAFLLVAGCLKIVQAQATKEYRVLTVGVPFLLVPGDARAAGMGDMGIATAPDTYAQQWNAAKYIFNPQDQGIGLSYVPYLRKLTNDINVGQLNYFRRLNERSAFAASIRYFNLGEVSSRQSATETGLILRPNQFAVDGSYSLKLSETFAMGITARYIRSDLKIQTSIEDAAAINSFAVDISGYLESRLLHFQNFEGQWRAGFNISNIGPKLKYSSSNEESFLPTNLGIGAGFDFILNKDNTLGVYTEFNKLLVPTPSDSNADGVINREDDYYNKNALEGIFSSFTDSPGGLQEELKEITWAVGVEYFFKNNFSLRTGYRHESPEKGFRQYLTLGTGFTYSIARIQLSYLFSTAHTQVNPLEGGLRFSLAFDLSKIR